MEHDKLVARKRAQSLWRFMQLIEASRHQAERLDALAPSIPEQLRSTLASAAGQLRECANELHAMWMTNERSDDGAAGNVQRAGAPARQFS